MSKTRTKWEYHTAHYAAAAPSVAKLNELGADGWELIQTDPIAGVHGYSPTVLCLFKRPVQEPAA